MNPQMQQQYRQYAQAQGRSPAAVRRPGECDSSTWISQTPNLSPGSPQVYSLQPPPKMKPLVAGPRTRSMTAVLQSSLLRSFQTPPVRYPQFQAGAPRLALRRVLEAMTPDQCMRYLKDHPPSFDVEFPSQETCSPHLAGMQGNPNQAAAQHQRQIYEQQMAQRNAALEHQLAQRRARKPTDRNMPEGIEDLIIGDGVQQYKDLREIERKLDYSIMRKRLDIQDTVHRNAKRQKTMRIWISNTAENQPWQRPALDENSFDFDTGADATYKVKIEGKILDEPDDDVLASDNDEDQEMANTEDHEKVKRPQTKHKMSHYFKSISVEFDKARTTTAGANTNLDPSMRIEWEKTAQSTEFDCLEFTRKGDENINITINLVRDEPVERFRLSQALAGTLDMEEADRAEAVMGIWEYVKAMGLQEDEERRLVRCDDRLKGIFGLDSFLFPQVADRIVPHLHPLTPIKLHYTIRLDQDFFSPTPESQASTSPPPPSTTSTSGEPTIYDLTLTTSEPLRTHLAPSPANPQQQSTLQTLRQIATLDDQLAVLIQSLSHHRARHAFFKSFSKDPIAFLKRWQTSQSHDLAVLLGEVERWDVSGLEFAASGPGGVWGDGSLGRGSAVGVVGGDGGNTGRGSGLAGREGVVREIVRGRLGREAVGVSGAAGR